jgi:uncharacterized protein YbaR (Trm112 family)
MSEPVPETGSEPVPEGPRVDPRILEILVCPLTKGLLVYDAAKQELLSRKAGLAYPIRNGVPLMTADAARTLTDDEMAKI